MTPVRVIAFPGAPNLPVFAALEHGLFAAEGLEVSLETTPSSVHQSEKLAAGAFEVAFTAFDNVVAYSEGQGAVSFPEDPRFRAFMGATQLELAFVVRPEVERWEDLRGASLALDAPGTGFAFVLYDMLERNGIARADVGVAAVGATPQRWQAVKAGAHAGTLTIEPFTSIARHQGFRVMELSSRIYEAYQGGVVAARLDWLRAERRTAEAFARGCRAGLAWTLDPANRGAARALLQARMPEIQPQALEPVMASLLSPRSGLTPGAAFLRDGMAKVLELRSRFGPGGRVLTDVDRYLEPVGVERAGG
jgi:ABC-type nitrate/sulfonate/bicarbonate transport system substrate-binding protein